MEENKVVAGKFESILKRNNSQIRSDKAESVVEEAELFYRRKVEDLHTKITRMRRDRDNILMRLSPSNVFTNEMADKFNGEEFSAADIQSGVDIRNLEIQLEIAQSRYEELFGAKLELK